MILGSFFSSCVESKTAGRVRYNLGGWWLVEGCCVLCGLLELVDWKKKEGKRREMLYSKVEIYHTTRLKYFPFEMFFVPVILLYCSVLSAKLFNFEQQNRCE